MSKKKMCPYECDDGCLCSKFGKKPKSGKVFGFSCPNNTNSKCEIISPKVSRYKTIKGWAGKAADGSWCFAEPTYGVLTYPAELRIKTKYLKPAKGKGEK